MEKEPGSTNIHFLSQQQSAQLVLPQKRYGHSSTLIKNNLYVFGGAYQKNSGGSAYYSFYECELKLDSSKDDLFRWKRITGEAPQTRDSHTAISFLDQLLIFGGSNSNKCFNDLYKYCVKSKIWTKLEPLADEGHQPSQREGHVAVLVEGDKMLIHGGINDDTKCFDDAYILIGLHQEIDQAQSEIKFDPETGKVSNIEELKNRKGQFQMLRWFKCENEGDVPSARDSHSATLANNQVYMFGGQDNNENLLNDFYKVTLQHAVKTIHRFNQPPT